MLTWVRYLQVVFILVFLLTMSGQSAEGACRDSGTIECKSGGKCISRNSVCNSQNDCPDGSDEDNRLCRLWPEKHVNCRYAGPSIFYSGGCRTADYMCRDPTRATNIDSRICKILLGPKLDIEEPMNMSSEVVALLNSAVNSTLNYKKPICPMLYTRVGDDCLSFFSPAKIPWAEARQFCISIYGDLWHMKDFASYGRLMEYMRAKELTSNYWIGGRYDIDTNAWSWTGDDSAMPLGAPFWTTKHETTCVPRAPPHTDPYSAPPTPPLSAPCYHTVMTPKERSSGWCSAMTYKYFYYWSDETCDEAYSPLCIFTGHEEVIDDSRT